MRAVRKPVAINWRLFLAVYAGSLLLAWAFGWVGFCAAFIIAVLLLRHVPAFFLRWIEDWYFDDGARDLTKPVDADNTGCGA